MKTKTLLCSLGAALSFAFAAAVSADASSVDTSTPEQLTEESAAAVFDEAWQKTLSADGKIPGAVITVVQDGRVVLEKGYGVADTDTGRPADAKETYLRIGSVSKVLSSVTALTLVDDGTVDLDEDVNTYLKDVQVPATFDKPVTIRSMLSHLSGFDAGISGWMVDSEAELYSDPAEHARRLIRINPVGRTYAYDNRGIGLMGHLIGQVTGGSFAGAMKARLFDPLGMTDSSMGWTDAIASKIAACHTVDENGNVVKCRHQHMREDVQACGDVTSTGADMSRFMLALLNGGELDGKRILSPALFQKFMDPDQNRLHPILPGMGFLIVEGDINGRRTMMHTGGMNGFSTNMTLFPESNTGVFISLFTSFPGIPEHDDTVIYRMALARRADAYGQLMPYHRMDVALESFANRFVKPAARHSNLTAPTRRDEPLSIVAGDYRSANAHVYPRRERMFIALSDPGHLEVKVSGEDVFIGGQGPYRESQPYVLERVGDPVRWVFASRDGSVLLNNTAYTATSTWLKDAGYHSGYLTVVPLFVAVLLCVSAGVYAALRHDAVPRRLALILFLVGIASLIGLLLEFQYFPGEYFSKGGSAFMVSWRGLINLSWLGALVAVGMAALRYRAWARWGSMRGVVESGYLALLALSALVIVVLLPYWGFIGNFTS